MGGESESGCNGDHKVDRLTDFEPWCAYREREGVDRFFGNGKRITWVVDSLVNHHADVLYPRSRRVNGGMLVAVEFKLYTFDGEIVTTMYCTSFKSFEFGGDVGWSNKNDFWVRSGNRLYVIHVKMITVFVGDKKYVGLR